jgi:hypothetical protein
MRWIFTYTWLSLVARAVLFVVALSTHRRILDVELSYVLIGVLLIWSLVDTWQRRKKKRSSPFCF